jgi:hypothetical protein
MTMLRRFVALSVGAYLSWHLGCTSHQSESLGEARQAASSVARPATEPDEAPATKPDEAPATKPDEAPATKPDEEPATKPDEEPAMAAEPGKEIVGVLRRLEMEGGFWGIIADDGQHYRPVGLEDKLEDLRDGRRIAVRGEVQKGGMGIFMWGRALSIEGARWLD